MAWRIGGIFKRRGVIIFLLLAIIVSNSYVFTSIGDNFFKTDKFSQANTFYFLSKILFPLRPDLDKRFLALNIEQTERQIHSEETGGDEGTVNYQKNVLGIAVTVPILMYHYIRINPNSGDQVGFNLSVTPSNFSAQMDYLAAHGYHTISPDDLGVALLTYSGLPLKPVIITFDDGYADSYYNAFPVLRSHGFKAVNFIITGLVGAPNYLSWGLIDEMRGSGLFTFGSHTIHHNALTSLNNNVVKKELSESKAVLGAHLGYQINWFAYPYGSVDQRVASLVRESGYIGSFGTNSGTFQSTDYMFTLPRIRIGGSDSLASFAGKLPWK